MIGVLLLGGLGSRLHPLTVSVNKHLLHVFDKPLFYYPLSSLILAGCQEIIFVCNERDTELFRNHFGSGDCLGVSLRYVNQDYNDGIVGALKSVAGVGVSSSICVLLGDNVFHAEDGVRFFNEFISDVGSSNAARVLSLAVSEPSRYGVVELSESGECERIVEKPRIPPSNLAVPGLYYLPKDWSKLIGLIKMSERGELEIVDLLNLYAAQNRLEVQRKGRGFCWFDAGTSDSIHEAASFVRSVQMRQGLVIGSPHECAVNQGLIPKKLMLENLGRQVGSSYVQSVIQSLKEVR